MKRIIIQNYFPAKINFEYIENIKVDYYPARILYKSFFAFLNIPKIVVSSFTNLLTYETERRSRISRNNLTPYEKQFFRIFDEMYSLEDKKPRLFNRKKINTGKLSIGIN